MANLNFEKLQEAIGRILTLHDIAVKNHGAKEVFAILKKGLSTGYNEMNTGILVDRLAYLADPSGSAPEQSAKLGVADFIIGMHVTQNLSPLVSMASFFNMACYEILDTELSKAEIMTRLQGLNKEYVEAVNETLEAVKDDTISAGEANKNIDELMGLVRGALSMISFYKHVKKMKGASIK